ncbi:hypothetical protein TIFTF001_018794 [Ficus carica]|uniref:Uncharacterized protein n=1 Tax=Ficus carica TaxID=3494 RepID=A0AA88D9K7_FICCA|nr:hypothetical protein TIFTF001_018794 [Ficus carica]
MKLRLEGPKPTPIVIYDLRSPSSEVTWSPMTKNRSKPSEETGVGGVVEERRRRLAGGQRQRLAERRM